jgi:hypothetical protein
MIHKLVNIRGKNNIIFFNKIVKSAYVFKNNNKFILKSYALSLA